MHTFRSSSSRETRALGERLAERILCVIPAKAGIQKRNSRFPIKSRMTEVNHRGALVIALAGDLGAGKTTFVQGFFRGLGIKKRATSPTFIIFRRFAIRRKRVMGQESGVMNVYHVDAYRIKDPQELAALGFGEILSNPKNIVLIEWPENGKNLIPKNAVNISFRHGKRESERCLTFPKNLP